MKIRTSLILFIFLWLIGCGNGQNVTASDAKIFSIVGVKSDGVVKANGQDGLLVYGPYLSLSEGIYRLIVVGDLKGFDPKQDRIEVVSGNGQNFITSKILDGSFVSKDGAFASIVFELDKPATDVEFKIFVSKGVSGNFEKFEIEKISGI